MCRTLLADEIDVRVSTVSVKGCSLLLYKDARADMIILDETVGAFNWMRSHSRDNANCTVSIWDDKKSQWIAKEDTGSESFTEKEKGLASDSFKRACFNHGIGRELYTAPFIWVNADSVNVQNKVDPKTGKTKYYTYDKFVVENIAYDDNRNIIELSIINSKMKKGAYVLGNSKKKPTPKPHITEHQAVDLLALCSGRGLDIATVLAKCKLKEFTDCPVDRYDGLVNFIEKMEVDK